ETAKSVQLDAPPRMGRRLSWLLLAALASLAFLASTNHLWQDIGVVAFMWGIPLTLYLLSFIICFDNERWYLRKRFGALTILSLVWLTAISNYSAVNDGMDYVQKVIALAFARPTFETAEEAEAYAKKTFSEKVEATQLHGRSIGFTIRKMPVK